MGVHEADGGDVAEYRAQSAAAGAHRAGDEARDEDAVVAGVERDIEGLLGAARGAQLAAVARHLASDASWALLEWHRRRARERKNNPSFRVDSAGPSVKNFSREPPGRYAVGSRYSLIQIIVFPAPTDAPSPMTSTASSRPTRRVGRLSAPARMSRSHSVAMACLFPLA